MAVYFFRVPVRYLRATFPGGAVGEVVVYHKVAQDGEGEAGPT